VKPLATLTLEDLQACPVWQYHGARDDEAQVSAAPGAQISEEWSPETPVYIALTEFVLANGQVYSGYTSPSDPSGLDYLQPVIIASGVHVRFWDDRTGGPSRDWRHLGSEHEVFPITWRSLVPVDGNAVGGRIPE